MDLLALYEKPEHADLLHTRYYVEGALFGASASPEIPMPDVWLPWAIKHHGQIQNNQQADEITAHLFDYFKHCLASMRDKNVALPDYCAYSAESDSALAQWLNGLLMAHKEMEELWLGAWQKMQQQAPESSPLLAKKLKRCLRMFTTFADPLLAIEQAKEREQADLADKLPIIFLSLPQALRDYVDLAGELASYLPNQFETFVQAQEPPVQ